MPPMRHAAADEPGVAALRHDGDAGRRRRRATAATSAVSRRPHDRERRPW